MTYSTFAKAALAAAGAASALFVAATPAGAQPQPGYYNGYNNGYAYDPCRRAEVNRGTTGALIGGTIGAVLGSNVAAGGVRTEGAVLGGALGAVAGAAVGKNTAACGHVPQYAPTTSGQPYYNDNRYGYPDNAYRGGDYSAYRNGTPSGGYIEDDRYDEGPEVYSTTQGAVGADGCTLAESPIYLPDGRVQKRFVRVCQDGNGRYQVVD
jgi:hypothetical protein